MQWWKTSMKPSLFHSIKTSCLFQHFPLTSMAVMNARLNFRTISCAWRAQYWRYRTEKTTPPLTLFQPESEGPNFHECWLHDHQRKNSELLSWKRGTCFIGKMIGHLSTFSRLSKQEDDSWIYTKHPSKDWREWNYIHIFDFLLAQIEEDKDDFLLTLLRRVFN